MLNKMVLSPIYGLGKVKNFIDGKCIVEYNFLSEIIEYFYVKENDVWINLDKSGDFLRLDFKNADILFVNLILNRVFIEYDDFSFENDVRFSLIDIFNKDNWLESVEFTKIYTKLTYLLNTHFDINKKLYNILIHNIVILEYYTYLMDLTPNDNLVDKIRLLEEDTYSFLLQKS